MPPTRPTLFFIIIIIFLLRSYIFFFLALTYVCEFHCTLITILSWKSCFFINNSLIYLTVSHSLRLFNLAFSGHREKCRRWREQRARMWWRVRIILLHSLPMKMLSKTLLSSGTLSGASILWWQPNLCKFFFRLHFFFFVHYYFKGDLHIDYNIIDRTVCDV